MIQRGGKSFQQTYWVSPGRAKELKQKAKKDVEATVKAGKSVFTELDAARDFTKLVDKYEDHAFRDELEVKLADKWKGKTLSEKDMRDSYRRIVDDAAETAIQYRPGYSGSTAEAVDNEARRMFPESIRRALVKSKTKEMLKDLKETFPDGGIRPWKQKSLALPEAPKPIELSPEEQHAAQDLLLTLDNDGQFYSKVLNGVKTRHTRAWQNGSYDQEKALDLLRRAVKTGVDEYYPSSDLAKLQEFTPNVVKQVARDFEELHRDFMEEMHGPLKDRQKPKSQPKGKRAMKDMVVEDSDVREEIEEGVEALDISYEDLADTYGAPEGFEFVVERTDFQDWNTTSLDVNGTIYDDDLRQVGTMKRSIHRDEEGDLHATHHLFKLNESAQDSGIGTRMVLNQFESYEALDVRSVSLDTAWVGKYLWLKLGFVPSEDDEPQLRSSISRFIDNADLEDDQKSAVYQMLDGDLNNFARIRGLPEVRYADPETGEDEYAPINKAALLHKHSYAWSGRIEVGGDDWDTTMEILNGYIDKDE